MDTPQMENGFVGIARPIFDALIKTKIPREQRQCLDYIIRRTYGWRRKKEILKLSDFCEATGLNKPNVSRSLKILKDRGIISISIIKNDKELLKSYGINKKYWEWKPLSYLKTSKKPLSKVIKNIIKTDNPTIYKDNKDKVILDQGPSFKSKHWEKNVGNLFEEIKKERDMIYSKLELLHIKDKKRNLNLDQWLQLKIKLKAHPKAILVCLQQLNKQFDMINAPWGFLNHKFDIENGKYHGRDSERLHEQIKNMDPGPLGSWAASLFKI